MDFIGIDIGTSTISGVLISGISGKGKKRITVANGSFRKSEPEWSNLQDPKMISEHCVSILRALSDHADDIGGIGLTGQMHGIVYVDESGMACSDLITWQDERGNRLFDDSQTYCERILAETGWNVATGFGLVTVYHDLINGMIPDDAKTICTIGDYVALCLTHRKDVMMHASNAASLGFYRSDRHRFDEESIEKLGMDISLLPDATANECIVGHTEDGIPVAIPIGDNQSSFIGSVGENVKALINIGTGSQISVYSEAFFESEDLECRPFIEGKYLINGSGLCGGSAYSLLESFFKDVLRSFGYPTEERILNKMDQIAEAAGGDGGLTIDTRFRGTRELPGVRGRITGLGINNFTAGYFSYAMMKGICEELYGFYERIPKEISETEAFVASGNGPRNSHVERQIIEKVFGKPVHISMSAEEAAYGAALLILQIITGNNWEKARKLIQYKAG